MEISKLAQEIKKLKLEIDEFKVFAVERLIEHLDECEQAGVEAADDHLGFLQDCFALFVDFKRHVVK